jgi:cell division septum initiation protein DivIVA
MTDEALRRSDELLNELIETVETARALPMSASCVLPRERLLDLLDELREVLPPEMDEARTLIATRERVLKDSYENAAHARERAVAEADAVLADAGHRASQVLADAERRAQEALETGRAEHGRLVAATTVHQSAAQAAAALRDEAEKYHRQLSADAELYDNKVRSAADQYAREARADAERYATKLTTDAEDYAERTLDELSVVLHRSAATAEQGRAALAQRRAGAWTEQSAGLTDADPGRDPRAALSA